MKYFIALFFCVTLSQAQGTQFTEKALADVFISETGEEIPFSEILEKHKGKTVFIDIWASWCKDCIKGMPKVKALQKNNKEVVYLNLSLDKEMKSWKRGIKKYKVVGENYFISSGWKGDFCSSIDLDWIPRYMIVNKEGDISLYKAIEADDPQLLSEISK